MVASANKKKAVKASTTRRRKAKAMKASGPARKTRHSGNMRADEVLTIDAFCERFKISRNHIVDMRRKGLVVRAESEKNLRILGSDYHDFLKTQPVATLAGMESPELAATTK